MGGQFRKCIVASAYPIRGLLQVYLPRSDVAPNNASMYVREIPAFHFPRFSSFSILLGDKKESVSFLFIFCRGHGNIIVLRILFEFRNYGVVASSFTLAE